MRTTLRGLLATGLMMMAAGSGLASTPHPCDLAPAAPAPVGGSLPDRLMIHWDDCSVTGQASKLFACDESTGPPFEAYLSIFLERPMVRLRGFNLDLWVYTDSSHPLEDWWRLLTCQRTAYSTGSFPVGTSSCSEISEVYALGEGGSAFDEGMLRPNAGRLRFAYQVAPFDTLIDSIPAFTEMTVFRLRLPRRSPTSASGCSGCEKPACIWFGNAYLYDGTENFPREITGDYSSILRWQEGGLDTGTPARLSSWGRLKSLYR